MTPHEIAEQLERMRPESPYENSPLARIMGVAAQALRTLAAEKAQAEQERDAEAPILRMLVRVLPEPPWYQREGGTDWERWADWLAAMVKDYRAQADRAEKAESALVALAQRTVAAEAKLAVIADAVNDTSVRHFIVCARVRRLLQEG